MLVCTGNTCRSPIAQALLQRRLDMLAADSGRTEYRIESAGLLSGDGYPASPEAVEVMREEGIDIRGHRSIGLKEKHIKKANLVLTMTTRHRDYLRELYPEKSDITYTICEIAEDLSGEVLDPYGLGLEAYRACLAQLKLLVDKLYDKIIESK